MVTFTHMHSCTIILFYHAAASVVKNSLGRPLFSELYAEGVGAALLCCSMRLFKTVISLRSLLSVESHERSSCLKSYWYSDVSTKESA